jgi:hypothetical protein
MRRLLIIGCGDVATRMIPLVRGRNVLYARERERFAELRALGLKPLWGDLDRPDTLGALPGLAHDVAHFAPPPHTGARDTRTAHLIAALAKRKSLPQQLVYISTSGSTASAAERSSTRRIRSGHRPSARSAAATPSAVSASGARAPKFESRCCAFPAFTRPTALPLSRPERGTRALRPEDDAYVNHVHAEDLARIVVAALHRGSVRDGIAAARAGRQ